MKSRRGRFLAIVGPDGAGKTTLARELLIRVEGEGRYVHWIPSILRGLARMPGDNPPDPKTFEVAHPVGSIIRLMANVVRFWLGFLARVSPAINQGRLVIADRWGYGYVGQPSALKYSGPAWFARVCVRLLPQPDLVVLLRGSPELIHKRKPELNTTEIVAELDRWSRLSTNRWLVLDSSESPSTLASEVLGMLEMENS